MRRRLRFPLHLIPLLISFLLFTLTKSDFLLADIENPYVLRFGASTCPNYLEFINPSLQLTASDISIRDTPCSEGVITLEENPLSTAIDNPMANYLSGTRETGKYISGSVTETLRCNGWSIVELVHFNFVRPNRNFTVEWPRVFSKSNPPLLQVRNSSFTFQRSIAHLVISDLCLMTELTTEEIDAQTAPLCFPANSLVQIKNGDWKRMDQIQIGDQVRVRDGRFERVNMWSHKDSRFEGLNYVKIIMKSGKELVVSAGHFVVMKNGLKRGSRIIIGDEVKGMDDGYEQVVRVSATRAKGLYNPHTESGEIVVNGVLCSTYTTAVKPVAAHALLAPIRMVWAFWTGMLDLRQSVI